ncbi:hypothetical protein ACCS91_27225 [Rhizobium ruizarguesonis]
MSLYKLAKLRHPISLRGGVQLEARALTIADSRRLSRRFPQYDFVRAIDHSRQGVPLLAVSEEGQRALVATSCLGCRAGDRDQEAAVARLTESERDEIVGAMLLLTFETGGVEFKGMRNGKVQITVRGVDFTVRQLQQPMLDGLAMRFPDIERLVFQGSPVAQLFDCSEPAINAFIAAGLGFAGDPVEEAAVARLNLVEQRDIIALMFGAVPDDPAAPPPRLAS